MLCSDINIDRWVDEFKEQESLRIHNRIDSTKIHHYILSFSKEDTKDVPIEFYRDIANTFINMLPPSKYLGVFHLDTSSLHLHVVGSGVNIENARANRISKESFQKIKIRLQEHHLNRWYEYTKHSEVNFKELSKRIEKVNEYFIKKAGKQSKRELLREKLEIIFNESSSKADFIKRIEKAGITTYQRGRSVGIITEQGQGRRWRIKSLGFSDDRFILLEQHHKQIMEMQKLRNKSQEKEKSIYYSRDTFKR